MYFEQVKSFVAEIADQQIQFSNLTFMIDENHLIGKNNPQRPATIHGGSICINSLPDKVYVQDNILGLHRFFDFIECPPEYFENAVAEFVNHLCIGKVSSIKITENKKVFVNFHYWYNYADTLQLIHKFTILKNAPHLKNTLHFFKSNIVQLDDCNNALSMNYLSISPVAEKPIFNIMTAPRLEIPEDKWTSLYIPFIPNGLSLDGQPFSHENLQDFIENKARIGKVRRIDFVDRDDLVKNPEDTPLKAAFIHMEYWCDIKNVHYLRNAAETQGYYRQQGYFNGVSFVNFTGNKGKEMYFSFKINHKPIPDADGTLNIHQLAALKTKYEKEIDDKNAEISRLTEELNNYRSNVEVDIEIGSTV